MVEGFIPDRSHATTIASWIEGKPEYSFLGNAKVDKPEFGVQAFRCPKCGLIKLYAIKRKY
jgi:hypothetical protein